MDLGTSLGLILMIQGLERPNEPGLRALRTIRDLQEGMVITVEPGCYFIDALLDPAMESSSLSEFFNYSGVKRFKNFGGVRIESDVAWMTLGRAQLNFGEPDASLESFNRALAIDPDSKEAQTDRETAMQLVKKRKQLHASGLTGTTETRFKVGDKANIS